jgi:hypothetical protein
MTLPEFLRIFPVRSPNLMWFLGAGASAASGIATAGDMIWDFKRRLYCTEQRVSIRACEDLSNPDLRAKIQRYLDGRGDCPVNSSEDEYSHYFSAVFPSEADRRRYIDQMITKATPSFGFVALGILLKLDRVRVVWTTNFDRNVEDAAASVLKTTAKLTVATLDTPQLLRQAIQEGRWPALGKLHGDFQSRRLKNTSEELQTQDAQFRRELVEACKRFGLVVSGYSGRDNSVMAALTEAIDQGHGFPAGLFWFTRNKVTPKVTDFINQARAAGIDAHVLDVPTFDELLADVVGQIADMPKEDADLLDTKTKRLTDAPLPHDRGGWPVIRLNAVEIIKFPSVCRLLKCQIGGMSEIIEAIDSAKANVIAMRKNAGVILFGSDAEAEKAFKDHQIDGSDVYTIEPRRMWYDSVEAGLVLAGLSQALSRERGLIAERRRSQRTLRIDPENESADTFKPVKSLLSTICGTVPSTKTVWAEAIEIHLAYRLNRLWLIIEPMVWVSKPEAAERDVVREFQRERLAKRYNRQANDLLSAWCDLISRELPITKVAAFGIQDGIDAQYEIGDTNAFSRRLNPR